MGHQRGRCYLCGKMQSRIKRHLISCRRKREKLENEPPTKRRIVSKVSPAGTKFGASAFFDADRFGKDSNPKKTVPRWDNAGPLVLKRIEVNMIKTIRTQILGGRPSAPMVLEPGPSVMDMLRAGSVSGAEVDLRKETMREEFEKMDIDS